MRDHVAPRAAGASALARLDGVGVRRRAVIADNVIRRALLTSAAAAIVIVVLVIVFIAIRAAPVLTSIGASAFFLSTRWDPDAAIGFGGLGHFGALTPVAGSLLAVALALLFAVPVALALAIVVAEVNPRLGRSLLRPAMEVFLGIPSVVYGYVGLVVLLPRLVPLGSPGNTGAGFLAAGVVLALMIIPTIATLSVDAFQSQPAALREGSIALGATQWQTISRVLLPASRAGVVSGVVLALARAMGEALAVALVIGDVQHLPDFPHHGLRALVEPGTTMTVAITDGLNNLAINPEGTAARYGLALILLAVTFSAIVVVRRLNRRGQVIV
ncbi:MAG TPA: phosphate ABC transporter permease subunit PstC [Candidatus Sulfotelmatobacter sp.]|nr:phosphate ABC transporter permease subunit PstC [Candidatus Sulfotelmatobacter sp.]